MEMTTTVPTMMPQLTKGCSRDPSAHDTWIERFVVGYFDGENEWRSVKGLILNGAPITKATFDSRSKANLLLSQIDSSHGAAIETVLAREVRR